MPISSSSARTIGDAPTICTALRWHSIAVDRVQQRAGADEVDALDVGHVDRRRSRDLARIRASCATNCGGTAGQHAVPRQRLGLRCRAAARGRRSGGLHADRSGGIGGGSHDGGDISKATAYSTARSSNAVLLVLPLHQLERQQPRAFAAVAASAHRRLAAQRAASPDAAASAAIRACGARPRAHRRAAARLRRRSRRPRRGRAAPAAPSSRSRAAGRRAACALARRELAGERDVAAADCLRPACGRSALPARPTPARERSNCTTYCSASWSNAARSSARCSRSNSASQASGESFASWSVCTPCSSSARAPVPARWRRAARRSRAPRTGRDWPARPRSTAAPGSIR